MKSKSYILSILLLFTFHSPTFSAQLSSALKRQQDAAQASIKQATAAVKTAIPGKTTAPTKAPATTTTKTTAPTKAPTKPSATAPSTGKQSPAPTDKAVTSVTSQIKDGKLATSALGPLADILNKVGTVLKTEIVDISNVGQYPLPIEFNPYKATSFSGKITFLNQQVTCIVILGQLKGSTGKTKLGFSLDLALDKNYKVKDLNFLSALGVKGSDLGKFGTIDLPKPHIIFSTFESYTNPESKTLIKAGVTVSTKTKIASMMKLIKTEANKLTGGQASKLPFLAKVNDNAEVAFNIAVGFTGITLDSFAANVSLPMELGVDLAKLRAQEKSFNPGIKAPFDGLNKPIKEVTGIINKPPLNDLKDISVGNFIASFGVEANSIKVSFGAELNVTTNFGTRYGMLGVVALTPEEMAIELRKSPSIQSMPLGNGVSIENIALATFTNFKVLATSGVPFSGLGLLGEIKFPFEGDSVVIGLAGQVKATGDFMMMGSVANLDARKLAALNASMIENVARLVKFDTSKLTEAMKQLPPMKINEAFFYVATKQVSLGGRIFPMGLGATLDVMIDKQKAKLSVAGNQKELAFMGYLSEIKTPIIVISGMGPDKKYGSADDGPIIDFVISADKPLKTNFDMSGSVELPPVQIKGSGDVSMGIGRIAANFSSNVANLFKADFDLQFNVQKISDARIGFELNAKERKGFLGLAFKELEKAIVKAQKGAAKVMLEPLRLLAKEIGKGVNNLDIGLPKKIAASLVAKTWSGSMEIDGGSFKLPVIGEIKLGIPKIEFSLKDPMKAIGKIAEKWAKQIVEDMKKLGKEVEKFAKEVGKGVETAAKETGKFVTETGKTIGKGTETAVKETGKAVTKAGQTVAKGTQTAVKETGKTVTKASQTVAKGTQTAVKETGKVATQAGKSIEKGAKSIGKAIGSLFEPKKKKRPTRAPQTADSRRKSLINLLPGLMHSLESQVKNAQTKNDKPKWQLQRNNTPQFTTFQLRKMLRDYREVKKTIDTYELIPYIPRLKAVREGINKLIKDNPESTSNLGAVHGLGRDNQLPRI